MKLYDLIKRLLEDNPEYRGSDKKLIWGIWERQGAIVDGVLSKESFISSKSTETIRRTRQKVQENFPHLKPTGAVKRHRAEVQRQKGTHIFRDYVTVIGEDNIARRAYKS